MKDDESSQYFHMNILDIANASGALGEKMTEEKLVRKSLRSLPLKFYMKVRLRLKNNQIKKKVFNAMGVMVLITLDLIVLLISRNNKKTMLFPGLMKMILKKNQMMKVYIMSQCLLEGLIQMKTLMVMILLMMNRLIHMKKFVLKERNKRKLLLS
jgi:hypothetical protein